MWPAVLPHVRDTQAPARCPRVPSPSGAFSPASLVPPRLQGRRTRREGQALGSVREDATALRWLRTSGSERARVRALPLGGTGAAASGPAAVFPRGFPAAAGFFAGEKCGSADPWQTESRLRPRSGAQSRGAGDREGWRRGGRIALTLRLGHTAINLRSTGRTWCSGPSAVSFRSRLRFAARGALPGYAFAPFGPPAAIMVAAPLSDSLLVPKKS
jgi:hypothetical protein